MIRHVYPIKDSKNGVYVYGKYLDKIINKIHLLNKTKYIAHYELGYTGHRELWMMRKDMNENNGAHFIVTIHDPIIVVGKPFKEFIPSEKFICKLFRKILDETIGRIMIKKLLRKADIILVLNKLAIKEISVAFGIDDKKIFYLPHPLYLSSKNKQINNNNNIIFFGNISERKRVDLVIKSYANLKNHASYNLKIIGSTKGNIGYYKKLRNLVSKMSLDNIEFTGFLPDAKLVENIKKSKVVILPYDNSGITHASGPMYIAMFFGVPVIASKIPTFESDIVSGKNGLLFREGDERGLSQSLNEILDNEELYNTISKNSREYVKLNNSDDIIYKRLRKIYNKL